MPGVLIAIGMFLSSLTESASVAAILALVVNLVILFMPSLANIVWEWKWKWLSDFLQKLALIDAFENFTKNIFSVPDVLCFVSISAAFLFLCVRILDMRRWS